MRQHKIKFCSDKQNWKEGKRKNWKPKLWILSKSTMNPPKKHNFFPISQILTSPNWFFNVFCITPSSCCSWRHHLSNTNFYHTHTWNLTNQPFLIPDNKAKTDFTIVKWKQISKEKSISGSHDTNLLSCLESIPGSDDGSWGGMSVGNFSLIWFDQESFVFVHLILPGELIKESMPWFSTLLVHVKDFCWCGLREATTAILGVCFLGHSLFSRFSNS